MKVNQSLEKELLIQAFKSLDFKALYNLLDNNRPYMDVSKDLFLSTLKKKLNAYRGLKSYENVLEGICTHCNKGCKAYKFQSENFPSLPLFFEEKNGKVTDIYLCNALKVESVDEGDREIYFSFYEDEKVNFKPSIDHLITLQRIEKAVGDFHSLESLGLVPIEEVIHWHNKMKVLAKDLKLNEPIFFLKYKAFKHIGSLYYSVSLLVQNVKKNHLAKSALESYDKIDKDVEKDIVKWLLENKDNDFYLLKKTKKWKKTGILILETEPNLVVDCSEYLDGYLFDEIFKGHKDDFLTKYDLPIEHYDPNKGYFEYSLEEYLKLHKK